MSTGSRTSRSQRAASSSGTSSASSERWSKDCALQGSRQAPSTRSASTPGESTSPCSTGRAGSCRTRCTTATGAGPTPSRPRCRSSRLASCTSARGSSTCPSTRSSSSPRSRPTPTLCSRPPTPFCSSPTSCTTGWAVGLWSSGRTQRRHSAGTSETAPGPSTCSSVSRFRHGRSPRSSRPEPSSGSSPTRSRKAPASHDTASAVAAVPLRHPRSAYVSAGTWSCVGVELEYPVVDDRTFTHNVTNEGGVGETFRLLRNVTGLWILHECRRAWALEGNEYGFDELVGLAQDSPPLRSLIDPDDARFAPPGDMSRRIREFCAETGQDEPVEPAAVVRCILESLALGHARVVKLLDEATGADPEEIHVVGGGAQNELLCRWTANAAGRPVLAGPVEAAAIGNLVVQAMALGELASIAEAREVIRASFEPVVYEPEGAVAWEEAWDRFQRLGDSRDRAGVGS